mgnify:CR=1 FL=1
MNSDARIIVIDDDIVFCETLAESLTKRDYQVSLAHSLSEVEKCQDLTEMSYAIVDLRLGEDSGLKVIQALLAANADMKILMLTAYASIATTVQAIKLGAINYLTKPVSLEEILAKLNLSASSVETPIEESHLSVRRLEWEHLQKVLLEHDGNISAAARALNMHRRTLQRKLQKRPAKR